MHRPGRDPRAHDTGAHGGAGQPSSKPGQTAHSVPGSAVPPQHVRPGYQGAHHRPPAAPGYEYHTTHAHTHASDGGGDHDAHGEHGDHGAHDPETFRRKFWGTFLLTIPVVVWSAHVQQILGYRAPEFPGSRWIPAVLGTVVFFYGGWVFVRGAADELRARMPGMMTLIALAISVAFVFSWVVQLGLIGAEPVWWELATLVAIMLLGHWIEMRSVSQARGALRELARLLPDRATRLTEAGEEVVLTADLRPGDLVLVRPGESVPADGVIRQGRSDIDQSMLTGESRPVPKAEGDEVAAGTINGAGSLRVVVTGTGEQTKLSGIMRLVAEAQRSRSRAQHLADRAAQLLTGVAIAAGVVTLIAWQIAGAPIDFSITRTVTVLVIACPHALGLAVPLVVSISTTLGARNGLLVRDRRGLEEARNIDTVIFDKTGTLTLGEFRVVDLAVAGGSTAEAALRIAAAVESDSEHPIARGIVRTAGERDLGIPPAEAFRAIPGKGVAATVEGSEYHMGGPNLLQAEGVEIPDELRTTAERAAARGQAAIYLLLKGRALAVFAVADAVREESRAAVDALHARGIRVAMLTGDSAAVARAVAEELGIDTVLAEVLPDEKASRVRQLQSGGRRVAMVGDGVNDAPALATADLGIAIGAGTDVAVEAGHIVLVRSDPRDIPRIIDLSRATYRKMIQNLWWAAGYNIVALPLAAGVLAAWGILLTPAVGAVLMSASTVVVAINAQLLRRTSL
ncbi:MAG TPA: heavy metal translocating P-type ATPase [Longimicrobiales bacterium]|nr:heavy metal translocating P-type ATPase [Longimicrobiales bacterium]